MDFIKVNGDKKKYIDLLLLADEQESAVDKYLSHGEMYLLKDGDSLFAECVVCKIDNNIIEIKNLAVETRFQKMGYGKKIIRCIEEKYKGEFKILRVGTGESPLTLPFYKKCGFHEVGRIKNFFIDNYDHEIIECGIKLVDMIILEKDL